MSDTTIKKVESQSSPHGEMGQKYLVAGRRVSMQLWVLEPGGELIKGATSRDYETVGLCDLGERPTGSGRTNPKSKNRKLVVGPCGSHAPIHDLRAIHGCGGDGAPC